MPLLEILNIDKEVDGQTILDKINLTVNEGEFFSLLGPSGCGKTTLLRLLAGLDTPTSGEIRLEGKRVDQLPAQKRPLNMVFQKYALFPHLTVLDNVAFGLRLKKVPSAEIRKRSLDALEMVSLRNFAHRRPETLSGGQAQRVAVARAIVNEPKILLLDEPLSALDQKMREHMQTELRALQRRLGLTFIYVTHDQEEAMILSDRIGVMNLGQLEQVATPKALYDDPKTFFVASFVGQMTKLSGKVIREDAREVHLGLENGASIKARKTDDFSAGETAVGFVRPERIQVFGENEAVPAGYNVLPGHVSQTVFRGDQTETEIDCAVTGKISSMMMSADHTWKVGDKVKIAFAPQETWIFDEAHP
jgi:spermidine/putrescine transport system ATP-binding protein